MDGGLNCLSFFGEERLIGELYEMISDTARYKEIFSLIKNKYLYAKSNEIVREMQDMFSNSMYVLIY